MIFFAKQEDILINHNYQHPSTKPLTSREGGSQYYKSRIQFLLYNIWYVMIVDMSLYDINFMVTITNWLIII